MVYLTERTTVALVPSTNVFSSFKSASAYKQVDTTRLLCMAYNTNFTNFLQIPQTDQICTEEIILPIDMILLN